MHKKILLFFIPLFLLASCSAPITFPNISEEINKYGIDVGQEDSA